ncbi:hypothetical protein F2Q70_00007677 [Brassica cretica]|uniref:Uncharacterized protein n=1 Tax=Brassica cretica TaxID=69181 RepID=A0A8S9M467_BRACR|nr:hypothetical protein F2Q70_00007677 [Brassica cretica]
MMNLYLEKGLKDPQKPNDPLNKPTYNEQDSTKDYALILYSEKDHQRLIRKVKTLPVSSRWKHARSIKSSSSNSYSRMIDRFLIIPPMFKTQTRNHLDKTSLKQSNLLEKDTSNLPLIRLKGRRQPIREERRSRVLVPETTSVLGVKMENKRVEIEFGLKE